MSEDTRDTISAAEIIAALSTAITSPRDINGTPIAIVPAGYQLHRADDLRETPIRTIAHPKLHTVESFIDYVNAHGDVYSIIFCDLRTAQFSAILDYHDGSAADWCTHRATYTCPSTPEWQDWLRNSGQKMNQEAFGAFIENQLDDIADPPGADLLEIALSLQAAKSVDFLSARRLDNGETQLSYKETVDAKAGRAGQLTIPSEITLGLQVFEGGPAYQVKARFRYRIQDANLALWYELIRPHKIHEAAVTAAVEAIQEGVELARFVFGTPN